MQEALCYDAVHAWGCVAFQLTFELLLGYPTDKPLSRFLQGFEKLQLDRMCYLLYILRFRFHHGHNQKSLLPLQ